MYKCDLEFHIILIIIFKHQILMLKMLQMPFERTKFSKNSLGGACPPLICTSAPALKMLHKYGFCMVMIYLPQMQYIVYCATLIFVPRSKRNSWRGTPKEQLVLQYPFLYTVLNCDTTHLYGIGKDTSLSIVNNFKMLATPSATPEVSIVRSVVCQKHLSD